MTKEQKTKKFDMFVSVILLAVITAVCLYFLQPYIANTFVKFSQISTYHLAYRSTFTSLVSISDLANNSVNPQEEDLQSNDSNYLEDLQFLDTLTDYKQFEQNEFDVESHIEKQNTKLSIPSTSIEGKVFDGKSELTLSKGFWYIPTSALPGEKGNTVIIGHRFLKLPPAKDTFFYLDRVNIGDRIEIVQDGRLLSYTVIEKKVVAPNEREVIFPTNDYRLTLITCTPLWENTNRLVIVATLDNLEQGI